MVQPELAAFRSAVSARLGLRFGDDKGALLEEALRARARAAGRRPADYVEALQRNGSPSEDAALAGLLAVTETCFFREPAHFAILADEVLPRLRASGTAPRLLSAACASGEEAYSLAILLKERLPEGAPRLPVRAVDLHPGALRAARRGVYPEWSLRGVDAGLRAKYFVPEGKGFALRADLAALVRFESRNLAREDPELWAPRSLDAVFCRNLLMYFEPAAAAALVAQIARALAPGGRLFLGQAENLHGMGRAFRTVPSHGAFCYERLPDSAIPSGPGEGGGWVGAIADSAGRVRALSRSRRPAERARAAPDLAAVRDLMARERYTEALEALGGPGGGERRGEALLTRAAVLAQLGRVDEARIACARLLKRRECRAGAHYIAALCHEHADQPELAREQNQAALRQDPDFAPALLHLGMLARRLGDLAAARECFTRALPLLEREDPGRIALYGGGFTREGLVKVCRGALDETGVA